MIPAEGSGAKERSGLLPHSSSAGCKTLPDQRGAPSVCPSGSQLPRGGSLLAGRCTISDAELREKKPRGRGILPLERRNVREVHVLRAGKEDVPVRPVHGGGDVPAAGGKAVRLVHGAGAQVPLAK